MEKLTAPVSLSMEAPRGSGLPTLGAIEPLISGEAAWPERADQSAFVATALGLSSIGGADGVIPSMLGGSVSSLVEMASMRCACFFCGVRRCAGHLKSEKVEVECRMRGCCRDYILMLGCIIETI